MKNIDYTRKHRRTRFKQTLATKTKKTIKALITTLTMMIFVLLITFFATTTNNAQKGYSLEQAKLKNEELKSKNSSLTNKITEATAFVEIQEEYAITEMETPEEKNYVTIEDNSVY
ncbi:hypothetical protein HN709_04890 [Candidatus Peregrinibacteria bacterium]|jgi:hypothetical protein|nr:hypothetical protein [Candidatus Peregrinibacteria bacterium]MBT7736999.1 hypothetical protein [Candidatus Peregrinibacteria bacterium]